MLVKCIVNNIDCVDNTSEIGKEIHNSMGTDTREFNITIGRAYVVYATAVRKTGLWYFIADDSYESGSYPVSYSSILFEVVDDRSSTCWVYKDDIDRITDHSEKLVSFEEWIANRSFYEDLVDGKENVISIFRKKKRFMDLEFANPFEGQIAILLVDDWVQCTKCDETWETKTRSEMIECPRCHSLHLNPAIVA